MVPSVSVDLCTHPGTLRTNEQMKEHCWLCRQTVMMTMIKRCGSEENTLTHPWRVTGPDSEGEKGLTRHISQKLN